LSECIEILSELKYKRISKNEKEIFSDIAKKTFEIEFGKNLAKTLPDLLSIKIKKPENEIMTNPELLKQGLTKIIHTSGTEQIFHLIKQTLSEMLGTQTENLSIDELVK